MWTLGGKRSVGDSVVANMKAVGKRGFEWDLNDWKWDGNRLLASPLNTGACDRRSSQCSPVVPDLQLGANTDVGVFNSALPCPGERGTINENGVRWMEKKRTIVVIHEDEEVNEEARPINLRLGEQAYPIVEAEGDKGKKSKNGGTIHPICQVEGCMADLTNARDYNRRHKVCEVHSKAPEAKVGNVIQRFCQQCSRFHGIQEFDGDKRSCRKRLAGHNKRRRKNIPETCPNAGSVNDELNSGQILTLLLRVLSNMPTNGSAQANGLDLLSQILRNLAASSGGSNTSGLLLGSQASPDMGTSNGIPEKDRSNQKPSQTAAYAPTRPLMSGNQTDVLQVTSVPQPKVLRATSDSLPSSGRVQEASVEKHIRGGIDLNTVCDDDSEDCRDDPANGVNSATGMYWAEQTLPSPPPTSGNSASSSGRSSSSSGEAQCRTDRIIFKLFDKDPNVLPNGLRTEILDWLSQSPTDIEGYIRPGCIVLTLYLRLNSSLWEQFCFDIKSSLSRLLEVSNDPFWKTGWIYTRIQQRAAFICDGQVVLDTPLPLKSLRSQISSISPIALPTGETVKLVVRGSNLSGPTSRLLCGIEGTYLVQENCHHLVESTEVNTEQDEIQSLSFSCSVPNVLGRGFVEVEDYDLTGCFFPFIVAEPELCYEICTLEREMQVVIKDKDNPAENDVTDAKYKALDFVHEMGWLLHRNSLTLKDNQQGSHLNLFSFKRLKWLVEFSMDHDWPSVLRKLLDSLFSGIVDIGDHASVEDGLADIALLHTAVRRNSRLMVEFLLRYVPSKDGNTVVGLKQNQRDYGTPGNMLFKPDVVTAGGLTPLHIAASSKGSENVLEALLEDPGMVGIEAWKKARDSTGLTPSDYASLRGHYGYLQLVQRKTNTKSSDKHVVIDIPSFSRLQLNQIATDKLKSTEFDSFYTEKPQTRQSCKLCTMIPEHRFRSGPLTFRPLMISLVTIAVICVCTTLYFKSEPQVCGIFGPFRWETLKYGAM
ncbi:hypothetical protein vseg_014936 [Gypsophila vaccaria]